ncbi:MAG: 5-formyltetrahydrofolate cyclo-ligase, partial [Rothia dentocariosa]
MKPEPSTVSAPHESNDAPHSKTPEDIALDKQILRSQIRPQRLIAKNARTAAEHEQMTQHYRDHILSLIPEDAQAQTIAAYLPTASEPPITAALHELHARGHRILVPVVRPARTLAWVVWDPHVEHPLNGLGIAEPEGEEYDTQAFVAADLRLVPALAYARNGRRLGQGGGYYD